MSRLFPVRRRKPQISPVVKLSAKGIAKVLGDLEARVILAVWRIGSPAAAKAIHRQVKQKHSVELLTVITVLNKLVVKRLLSRRKREDLFHYEAVMTQEEFVHFASRSAIEGILSLGPAAVTASFVDLLEEQDPGRLDELARLVRQRQRERKD